MAPKRKCTCNNDLKTKYPFLSTTATDSDLYCSTCKGSFGISSRGDADIKKHLNTDKHKNALSAAATSQRLTTYFTTQSTEDLHIAACEGTWAYHTIKENHSFRSADSAKKIFRTCFHFYKFSCSRTKCEAIAKNVFAPLQIRC